MCRTRTILQQTDVPGSNYTVVMAVTEIAANMTAARHTHPGPEVSYMLAGEAEFTIEGQGIKRVKAGESFRLESGVKHSVKNGPARPRILAIYTIPKGAPWLHRAGVTPELGRWDRFNYCRPVLPNGRARRCPLPQRSTFSKL